MNVVKDRWIGSLIGIIGFLALWGCFRLAYQLQHVPNSNPRDPSQADESKGQIRYPNLPFLSPSATVLPWLSNIESYDQIIEYSSVDEVQRLAHDLMTGKFCKEIFPNVLEDHQPRRLINVTVSCGDLFERSGMGTGNLVAALYALRLAAHAVGHTDVNVYCPDAYRFQAELVIPWLTGEFPAVRHSVTATNRTKPSINEACTHFNKIALGYKIPSMRFELRRMAIALVGVRDSDHPSMQFWNTLMTMTDTESPDGSVMGLSLTNVSLYPYTELDDAVLHFRCGDLIASNHPSFGFMKFRSFSRHIASNVQSIGIVTQPFQINGQQRPAERVQMKLDRCRLVVTEFVGHLRKYFPRARITIRNDESETIALTYARMVMANQTISAISSFSVMPTLATFGFGYIRKPDFGKAPNRFLLHPNIEELVDNVKLIEEPRLMAAEVNKMWGVNGTDVLNWFHGDVP